MSRLFPLAVMALFAGALAACDSHDDAPAPPARPVLSIVASPQNKQRIGFAGVIEPRYQTDRAFQVLGRILSRNVDVGDVVKKGQTLATNDPLTYQLAVRTAESDLMTAKSQLDKTTAQQKRTSTLTKQGNYTQADLDTAQQAMDASSASVQQAQARLAKAKEQLGYTTLTSDLDGVVTAVYADVGQMASPGSKVMTLARTDVREAVVDVPEDVARSLSAGAPFTIVLQADPSIKSPGKVREIAPEADATTRLRRIKITLDRSDDPFRLGATIFATPEIEAGSGSITVPATALFERDGGTRVWVVDDKAKTVKSVAVQIADRVDGVAQISGGLDSGARVVIAGVHSLNEGQAVRLGQEATK